MAVDSEGRFGYPERGWSSGKIRKGGQKPDEDEKVQLAMHFSRRGRPEFGGADIERAAGMGMRARGAVTRGAEGLSPEKIAEQKSAIQAMASQWTANVDWTKVRREVPKGWSLLWTPLEVTGTPATSIRGANVQMFKKELEKGVESYKTKMAEVLKEREKKRRTVGLRDPNGDTHEIPLENWEE